MVLAHHAVELAAGRADEHGVGRQRTDDVRSPLPSADDRGLDHAAFFVAEGAGLTRVRVQRGDRQPRPIQAVESTQMSLRQRDGRCDTLYRQCRRHRGQPQMRRDQHHAQAAADEHHAHLGRAGQTGQQFGVAGIPVPGRVPHGFADRRGDQSVQVAVHGEPDAGFHAAVGRVAAGRGRAARDAGSGIEFRNGQHRQPVRVRGIGVARLPGVRPQPCGETFDGFLDERHVAQHDRPAARLRGIANRGRGMDGDLRTDAGRIAQGHADQGSGVHDRAAAARVRTATASPARRSSWGIRAGRATRLPRRRPGPTRFR